MRDMANVTFAAGIDMLTDRVGVREGNGFLRGASETRKMIVDGQRVGYHKHVLDGPGASQRPSDEQLAAEEAELTARLEEVRERRGA